MFKRKDSEMYAQVPSPLTPPSASTNQKFVSPYDPSHFEFSFESIFDHTGCNQEFEKYLESTHNKDPLVFLQRVEAYAMLKSSRNRHLEAKSIIKEFIRPNSKHEVNVGNSLRQQVMDQFAQYTENDCPKNLFEKVYLQIFVELKEDCFPKFLASELFKQFFIAKMYSQGESYFANIAVRKRKDEETDVSHHSPDDQCSFEVNNSSTSDEQSLDLTNPYINDIHFEYLEKQFKADDDWKRSGKSKYEGREVYISRRTYAMSDDTGKTSRQMKKFKETGLISYPLEEVLFAMIDTKTVGLSEYNLKHQEQVGYYPINTNNNKYASTVTHTKFSMPFPMHNRDFVLAITVKREANGFTMFRKSTPHDAVRKKARGCLRAECVMGIRLERVYKDVTRYSVTALMDLHGLIPISLWNRIISQRHDEFHEGLLKACATRREVYGEKAATTPPEDSCGVYETLVDNDAADSIH